MEETSVILAKLDEKITRLKREYDLYLSGNRPTEPTRLSDEIDRDILRITKAPFTSTVDRFKMKMLANRFRAQINQARNLLELRNRRAAAAVRAAGVSDDHVVVDKAALDNPALLDASLEHIAKKLSAGQEGMRVTTGSLRASLFRRAKTLLRNSEIEGVRFSVTDTEDGLKVTGQVVKKS